MTEFTFQTIMYFDVNGLYAHIMANCKLPYNLVEHKVHGEHIDYTYEKIKELSEDVEHTYFFIIDASISETMIEKNPALKYRGPKKMLTLTLKCLIIQTITDNKWNVL